jgi:HEAT repeat protein
MSKKTSRTGRTVRSLLLMAGVGAVLAAYNIYANNRDVTVATGPKGDSQHAFFVNAAERPDINVFFKSLTPAQRLQMARNIRRYDDPTMANLIGKCLESFDAQARDELTKSMAVIARSQPKAVAQQLELKGSFQQLAVAKALRESGSDVLDMVAERLTNADARPNASSYLVASGKSAIPSVLPQLDSKDKDVRLAAADVLGKLRSRQAVDELTSKYRSTKGDEQYGYLAAIAGIGDPSSQRLLESALEDSSLPVPQRAQAELGLGRIASPATVELLWTYIDDEQRQLRESAITALQISGDVALRHAPNDVANQLAVASGVHSDLANSIIAGALGTSNVGEAAEAAHGRPELADVLVTHLRSIEPDRQGDIADDLIDALASTPAGAAALKSLDKPALAGLVQRRLTLRGTQT